MRPRQYDTISGLVELARQSAVHLGVRMKVYGFKRNDGTWCYYSKITNRKKNGIESL